MTNTIAEDIGPDGSLVALDQRFEACVAHLVGAAQSWISGPTPANVEQAIRELREYFYERRAPEQEGIVKRKDQ